PRRLSRDVVIRVVEILARAGADRLHVDAEPVHVRKPLDDRVEGAAHGGELRAVHLHRLCAGEIVYARRGARMPRLDDGIGCRNAEMAMNVDDEVLSAGRDPNGRSISASRDGHASSSAGRIVPLLSPKPIDTYPSAMARARMVRVSP